MSPFNSEGPLSMKRFKTLILTNSPSQIDSIHSELHDQHDVIIDNEDFDLSKIRKTKEFDLLIMHGISLEKHFTIYESLSEYTYIKSTMVLPREYSTSYLADGINALRQFRHKEIGIINSLNSVQHDSVPLTHTPQNIHTDASNSMNPELYISGFMLGSFKVLVNGLGIHEWHGRKAKSLLAYLLYNRKYANSREIIMDKFWPNVSPQAARNSLNGIIHKIRRMLKCLDPKNDYILFKEEKYLLNPEISINLDYESFLSSFKTGQSLEREHGIEKAIQYYEEAIRIYKGDFLQDNIYDEWTYSERESFKQKYLHALDRLSSHYLLQKKYLLAQQYCRKMLEKDDCLEPIHRRLMTCLYKNGYRNLAVKQFHKCAESLKKGLEMKPGQKTIELLNMVINDSI